MAEAAPEREPARFCIEAMAFMSSDTLFKSAPQNSQRLFVVISAVCRKRLGLEPNDVVEAGVQAQCVKWETRQYDSAPLVCSTCNPSKCVVTVIQCDSVKQSPEPVNFSDADCSVPPDVQERLMAPASSGEEVMNERYNFQTRIFCTSSRDHLLGSVVMRIKLAPNVFIWTHPFVLRSRNTKTKAWRQKLVSSQKARTTETIVFWKEGASVGRRQIDDRQGSSPEHGELAMMQGKRVDKRSMKAEDDEDDEDREWEEGVKRRRIAARPRSPEGDSNSTPPVAVKTAAVHVILQQTQTAPATQDLTCTPTINIGKWESNLCDLLSVKARPGVKLAVSVYHTGVDESGCNQAFGHITALAHFTIRGITDARFGFFPPGTVAFPQVANVMTALGQGVGVAFLDSLKGMATTLSPRSFCLCTGAFATETDARSFGELVRGYFANTATVDYLPFSNVFHNDMFRLNLVTHLCELLNF
eukprot:TRINITY_DN7727_c0_g1_i1.p1 TRINITY_DN7727_c0_g1~~TRINITY_DN7727_c0_g1_i1.p1  ORF type:complete len:472 (+),score=101.82 TRINITY_DN7727_c0_g1_i1:62-1477(+)